MADAVAPDGTGGSMSEAEDTANRPPALLNPPRYCEIASFGGVGINNARGVWPYDWNGEARQAGMSQIVAKYYV